MDDYAAQAEVVEERFDDLGPDADVEVSSSKRDAFADAVPEDSHHTQLFSEAAETHLKRSRDWSAAQNEFRWTEQRQAAYSEEVAERLDEWAAEKPDELPVEWSAAGSVSIRQQQRISEGTIDLDDSPPSAIWKRIATSTEFQDALIDAVRTALADVPSHERARALEDAGLDGPWAPVAWVLTGLDRPHEDVSKTDFADRRRRPVAAQYEALQRHQDALDLVSGIGQPDPTIVGHLGLEVVDGLMDVLDAGDATFGLDVRLRRDWFERRADQRRQTLRLLFALARCADVSIIATTLTQRRLAQLHREMLPPGVREQCNAPTTSPPSGTVDVESLVRTAQQRFDPDETHVSILRKLASYDSETASYRALYSGFPGHDDQTIRGHLKLLRDHELIESYGPDHDRRVRLMPAGRAYVADLTQQATLPESVDAVQKSIDNSRVPRRQTQGEGGTTPGSSGTTPDAEQETAEAIATPDRPRNRMGDGYASVNYLNRREETVYRTLSPDRGIALHDYPVDVQTDRREPSWGYDYDEDVLVVAAEYDNPMQYLVSIARALASPRTWEKVLTPARVDGAAGDGLGGLGISDPALLRDLCNVGWLDSRTIDDRDDLCEALTVGLEQVLDLTRRLSQGDHEEDVADLRAEITRKASGLAGSMEMLLWLAGVEVCRVVKVPRYAQDFDGEDAEDLARNLAIQASICSQYGGQPLYRLLYEQDQSKVDRAVEPQVEGPNTWARLLGKVLVVGPGVEDLEDPLDRLLDNPLEPREGAPELAARIPVRSHVPRSVYAELVGWALRNKGGLRPSRRAVSVLRALLPSPIDAINALHWLSSEASSRGLRLDEVRCAVAQALQEGTVDERRLLPGRPSTPRQIVATLLTAESMSQADLVDAAGISAQSFRNWRDKLHALGLLVALDGGDAVDSIHPRTDYQYRLALPVDHVEAERVERDDEDVLDVALPWWVVDDLATAPQVLWEMAERLVDDVQEIVDPEHPVGRCFYADRDGLPPVQDLVDEWPWIAALLPIVRALVDAPDPPDSTAFLGVREPQKRLAAYTRRDVGPELASLQNTS